VTYAFLIDRAVTKTESPPVLPSEIMVISYIPWYAARRQNVFA